MDREDAILVLTLERTAHRKDGLVERAIDMAIAALREQEQNKYCPMCGRKLGGAE